ncbi:MAG: zf-HC2 domain-containing protein [Gemmatimonadales bacterium]
MPHLDEGTIHSWLDGALSADEAARAEAHVKECPACAAAVAEVRGFIAGSSRILMALDNAPRGVIPAVAPRKRFDPIVWRIAATLLVVAGGTLVVVRNIGNERNAASTATDNKAVSNPAAALAPAAEADVPPAMVSGAAASQSTAPVAKTAAAPTPVLEFPKKGVPTDSRLDVLPSKRKPIAAGGNVGAGAAMQRENAVSLSAGALSAGPPSAAKSNAPAPSAPLFAPSRVLGAVMADADAAAESPPRVVGTPRAIGEKRTLYEIAPGDTVLLAEVVQTQLGAFTVTGAGTEPRQTAEKSGAPANPGAAKAAAAPDTQPRTVQPLSAPAAAPLGRTMSAETSNGVTTITWIDPATGTTMRLSGKHSREELEGIRRRIEQARAAAAAQKKSP